MFFARLLLSNKHPFKVFRNKSCPSGRRSDPWRLWAGVQFRIGCHLFDVDLQKYCQPSKPTDSLRSPTQNRPSGAFKNSAWGRRSSASTLGVGGAGQHAAGAQDMAHSQNYARQECSHSITATMMCQNRVNYYMKHLLHFSESPVFCCFS